MLTTRILTSIEQLRSIAADWNQLWERSDSYHPANRCEPLASALDAWFADDPLRIATVWRDDRLLAGLPLVVRRKKGLVKVAELPNQCWNFNLELLLDRDADAVPVVKRLMRDLDDLHVAWIWLDWIRLDRPIWDAWQQAARSLGRPYRMYNRFEVGWIARPETPDALRSGWSRNWRKQMRRAARGLESIGSWSVIDYDPARLDEQLDWALELEHCGWKGRAGSSMLSHPSAERFFRAWARDLAAAGLLNLQFLMLDAHPIAFDLGSRCRGVVASQKVSFDERYAKCSPGQFLCAQQLERWAEGSWPEVVGLDTVGPITEATRRWTRSTYTVGRLVCATRSLWGTLGMAAYRAMDRLPHR